MYSLTGNVDAPVPVLDLSATRDEQITKRRLLRGKTTPELDKSSLSDVSKSVSKRLSVYEAN